VTGSPFNWISETFSSDSSEDDVVKSRSLNITRITGVVLPVLVGITTAIGEVKDTPPFDDVAFQKRVIIAMILLVGAVTVADILGRSIAARATRAVSTALPSAVAAKQTVDANTKIAGHVVAFRTTNSEAPASEGEYLFVPSEAENKPSWQKATALTFG
jgi:hypothetical protein